ncbi:MAG TPA: efflux RND transporter periplasmic adaptor subunit [Bryobacteraceae bacterium]|jgi:HlyD family secretion protein|nr:efflux RND transporter periplasmic adaptor subunit [Bryobacteraceae bacterium]
MKKIIFAVIVIAVLGAAGMLAYRSLHPEATNRIVVSGNIELEQVDIAFKTSGRLIERTVNEGDTVQKGMVIARLDREQLLHQRDTAVAALATAQAQFAESESALKWQRESMQADMQLRNADLSAAQSQLLQLKNGARPQEIQQATAAVAAAQSQYDGAKKDWDRAQTLYKNDDISTSQYDQFRTRFESAQASLNQVKEQANLVQAGPRSETIESASAQVKRAEASLRVGQANAIETKRREQDIVARQGDIERAKAQIALIDSQLADTIAVSPINGVVLVKAADVGEVLAPGTSVVTVGDIDHPWLRAYIREQDLGRVKLGDKVRVTTDSFHDKVYDGHISFISSDAEFTPKQIQTAEERVKLVYRVKIDVDNPRHELKSNMPADAEILTGN